MTATMANLGHSLSGSGVPVLFIHGTQPDRGVFAATRAALGGRCRAITYDRRGFSASGGPAGADYDIHAADAAALLERLGTGPAVVVGWSWGGLVAMELAAARPDLVRALLLVEPAYHLKKHPTPAVLRAVVGAILLGKLGLRQRAVALFFNWALGRRGQPGTYATMDPSLRATVEANAPAILAELACGTGERLGEARLRGLRVPTLVLVGALTDPAFVAGAERVRAAIPGARLHRVEGAGHAIPLDRPDALAQQVLALAAAQPAAVA